MDSSQSFRSPSPDPLAISQENIAASSPTRITPKTTPRKPLQHSAGNICSQDFYLTTPPAPSFSSSPLKPGHLAGNPTSPWRIRVTVEAEPKHARDASPGRLLTRHTTTTTVPLKTGVDSSPAPAKRGRGRPRKSLDGPMESSGTTKTKITRKRKTMAEVVEGKATEAISESATPVRRGRGRPRKSLGSEIHGSEAGMVEEEEIGIQQSVNPDEPDPEQRKPRSKSRDRRKAISPTTASASDTGGTPFTVEQNHVAIVSEIGTPRMQAGDSCGSSPEESPYPTSALGRADEAKWRSKLRHDSLSPVCHNQETSARNWAFSCISKTKRVGPNTDPTEEHQEYDSIIESEGFSMISHSSLPSAQQASVGALVLDDPNTLQAPANRVASRGDIPAASLQRLSDHKTPAVAPSPQQPPPLLSARARPSPRQLEKSTGGTPKLTRIVRAGIALQGVLSPKNGSTERSPSTAGTRSSFQPESAKTSKQRMDDLFSGFGPGTRRELRAGLRFGEELAKRRQASQGNANMRSEDDVFSEEVKTTYPQLPDTAEPRDYNLKVPASEQQVQYPVLKRQQLPSPEESLLDDEDRMSWKATSPQRGEEVLPKAQHHVDRQRAKPQVTSGTLDTREAEWQREREAVSKTIEEASSSQVIIINSDSENEHDPSEVDEDDYDIWQAEARSSESVDESSQDAVMALLTSEAPRPKRSKIPNTWRKQSQVVYSDEVETTEQESSLHPTDEAVRAIHKGDLAQQQMHQESSLIPEHQTTESSEEPVTPEHDTMYSYDDQPPSLGSSPITTEPQMETTITKTERVKTERILFPKPHISTTTPRSPSPHLHRATHHPPTQLSAPSSFLNRLFGLPQPTLILPQPLTPIRMNLYTSIKAPIYSHTPWTLLHDYILLTYYLSPTPPPFFPVSPNIHLLSTPFSLDGWVHYFNKHDIAVMDKFLAVLRQKGVRREGWWWNGDEEVIDVRVVARKIWGWWREGVMRGDLKVGGGRRDGAGETASVGDRDGVGGLSASWQDRLVSKGDTTGLMPGTRRLWTRADVVPSKGQGLDIEALLQGKMGNE